jgi:hypothetical protein
VCHTVRRTSGFVRNSDVHGRIPNHRLITTTTTHTDVRNPDVQHPDISARAEFRPGDDGPLVVTLEVPDHVLNVAGGCFAELTETGEHRQGCLTKHSDRALSEC